MKIRVLGCSGAIAAGCRTTAFLLDDDVLIDAGSGVGDLTLDELVAIDHILLSHSHLDHVLSVALLADSVMRRRAAARRGPIEVHALPETIAALRAHVFNGVIWPDFARLPSAEQPVLAFVPFAQGEVLQLGGRRIEVLSASHTVPAVGFAVEVPAEADPAEAVAGLGGMAMDAAASDAREASDATGAAEAAGARHAVMTADANAPWARGTAGDLAPAASAWWVYTGDTGPNPALWARLRTMRVAQLVIETAFSDEERSIADLSRHLCPATLAGELAQIPREVEIHITHIKPGELPAVMREVEALGLPHRIRALETGQVLQVGDVSSWD